MSEPRITRLSEAGPSDETGIARIPLGRETYAVDSPCLGCGVYYFQMHNPGCEYEQCGRCGYSVVDCECPP